MSNIGNWNNYTGHILSAANTYACGRLAWDPTLSAEAIDREWATMTFPAGDSGDGNSDSSSSSGSGISRGDDGGDSGSGNPIADAVVGILGRSWLVYEG